MKADPMEAAIIDLHQWHAPAVQRFACRLLGSADEASDVTQETFARLYQNVRKGVKVECPQAWLYRVAANLCHDRLREKIRLEKKAPWIYREDDPAEAGMDTLIRQQDIWRLRHCLQVLSRRDRLLLLLYADGFSYAEIGEVAGIRKTSVGKILSRAIGRLRKKMKQGEVP